MGNILLREMERPNAMRSMYLKTPVNNTSDRRLTLRDYYSCDGTGYYGGVEMNVPAHTRETICSGKFLEEYLSYRNYQEIHVMDGERVLHAMSDDDFQDNKGKELLLELQEHGDLRYAFVDQSTRHTTAVHWIGGQPPLCGATSGYEAV